eukprot:12398890-Karenia_brevis.AAC.1
MASYNERQERQPPPPPPGPPPAWMAMNEHEVYRNMDWEHRQRLWQKARQNGIRGHYNRADVYLVHEILLGEHGTFRGR